MGPRNFRFWLPTSIILILIFLALTFHLSSSNPSFITPDLLRNPIQALNSVGSPAKGEDKQDRQDKQDKHIWPGQDLISWQKPQDLRVVALIFYGRRDFVRVLDCYLRKNLVRNGGMLDEVIFIKRTENKDDIIWLDEAVAKTPEYTKSTNATGRGRNFADAYSIVEKGIMYIKIDDDIVYIEDTAIPALVQRKYLHPEYLAVSANSLNQPAISWVHFHLNAYRPYLPELTPPITSESTNPIPGDPPVLKWRASELPIWTGPANYTITGDQPAPFRNHRWLPLPPGTDILATPAHVLDYNAGGAGFYSWVVGAQTHYSFLENLEKNELWRYKFDLWDYHYERLSINFVAFMGDDIVENGPVPPRDEWWLTQYLPNKLKRHVVMDGRGLTVHFGFRRQTGTLQGHALGWTDALDRYRAYANEMVCDVNM